MWQHFCVLSSAKFESKSVGQFYICRMWVIRCDLSLFTALWMLPVLWKNSRLSFHCTFLTWLCPHKILNLSLVNCPPSCISSFTRSSNLFHLPGLSQALHSSTPSVGCLWASDPLFTCVIQSSPSEPYSPLMTLKLGAASASKTWVTAYRSTWRHQPPFVHLMLRLC